MAIELTLYLPSQFLDSTKEDLYESPSEAMSHEILSVVLGIDTMKIRKGNPKAHEPDCLLPDGSGVEVVWGEPESTLCQLNGVIPLENSGVLLQTIEHRIMKRIDSKVQKANNGNYSSASKISVCCVLVTPIIQWYFTAAGYEKCSAGQTADDCAKYKRELFWRALHYQYIENGPLDNIYIVCPTHDKRYACIDIKSYIADEDWLTILGTFQPLSVPLIEIHDTHGEQITHLSQFYKFVISSGKPKNEGLYKNQSKLISDKFRLWQLECEGRFQQLKSNEEELNRIFIDIYGLQDELTPDVADKDVTVHRIFNTKDDVPESMQGSSYARLLRDEIASLISYAVGCMFGRYSLDVEGLAYAGGDWDSGKYSSFIPAHDNVLPITDEAYFQDDIVTRFAEFVSVVYGAETLEQNLDFVANALGNRGNSSREVIRNYFLKDFYKDHCKTYKKRPIYWLFDSGKVGGFKALIYLHRYDADTVGRVRADYLHKQQGFLENAIANCDYTLETSSNARDKADATKKKDKLVKQLAETRIYDQALAHIALQRIPLDLDDGVKVNYEKFQGIEIAREGQKALEIDLLAKI